MRIGIPLKALAIEQRDGFTAAAEPSVAAARMQRRSASAPSSRAVLPPYGAKSAPLGAVHIGGPLHEHVLPSPADRPARSWVGSSARTRRIERHRRPSWRKLHLLSSALNPTRRNDRMSETLRPPVEALFFMNFSPETAAAVPCGTSLEPRAPRRTGLCVQSFSAVRSR